MVSDLPVKIYVQNMEIAVRMRRHLILISFRQIN